MKKYKNVSGTPLALDCITKTVYMKPGEVLSLPRSRDIRYYSGLGKLVLIKERKMEVPVLNQEPIQPTLQAQEVLKKKKSSKRHEEKEEENYNNKMENE